MNPSDYDRIEKVIRYLEKDWESQPNLEKIARTVGLSPFHFQRLFKRWAGVSPKRFLQYLTVENAKRRLKESKSVLNTAYDSGLSGPGRLHDLFVSVEAMTPGEFKKQGRGLSISYGVHSTPFGKALIALSPRGICGFSFLGPGGKKKALADLKRNWPKASFAEEAEKTGKATDSLFSRDPKAAQTKLLLKGTLFQIKVWEALLKIPAGSVRAYQDVAESIGRPSAARAVGTAVGRNRIAFLIPCHRVIRETGAIGDYRWGSARKKALLAWEEARLTKGSR
jgi:AraC family transcriptional regulator of adaptative response/methylated-DNA-[protein]-cysteine methyltransferase